MLTSAELELLSLAVAGECTPAEDAQVRTLLAESTAALRAFQQLQKQRESLNKLPRRKAPAAIHKAVMSRLPKRPVEVAHPVRRSRLHWVAYATAACLLVAVGGATFWLTLKSGSQPELVQRQNLPSTKQPVSSPALMSSTIAQGRTPSTELAPLPRNASTIVAVQQPTPTETELAPSPRINSPEFVASPPTQDVPALTDVQLRLPWLAELSDLQKPEGIKRFAAELGKGTAFRLDLHSRDVHRGLEAFLNAAKEQNLKLQIDPLAQDRQSRKVPTQYAIYSESFTAEDWAKLIAALTPTGASGQDLPFSNLHLITASTPEVNDLRALLGVDIGLLKRTPTATNPKPLSAGTLDQVANNIRGTQPEEKLGVVLTHGPTSARTPPVQSKAVKAYLEQKGERKPNVIPMLIVIR
jgi:hypothetical protein